MADFLYEKTFSHDDERGYRRQTGRHGIHLEADSVRYVFPCECGHAIYGVAFPESNEDRFVPDETRDSEAFCTHCLEVFEVRYKTFFFYIGAWKKDGDYCVPDTDIYFRVINYSLSHKLSTRVPEEIDDIPF